MKQLITILLVLFSINMCYSQGASLTKEETVNYINKKFQEVEGHYQTIDMGSAAFWGPRYLKMYYSANKIQLSGSKLIVTRVRSNYQSLSSYTRNYYPCDYYRAEYVTTFDPLMIKEIKLNQENRANEPVGSISILLKSKIATVQYEGAGAKYKHDDGKCTELQYSKESQSIDHTGINFIQTDPANFNKIKQAFEYLIALLKAEDDPFGN